MKGLRKVAWALPLLLLPYTGSAQCLEDQKLFEQIPSKKSGLKFTNWLDEDGEMNFMSHTYFYNGAGVAVGDINNDGLEDIFFAANMRSSELYLNKGDLKFENITKSAGVGDGKEFWATGANMVDINADGWLDIYVCFSNEDDPETRTNRLYINQKDNTFKEEAAAYGLDEQGYGVQSAFFDYDNDGDLDMYLLNYNADHIPSTQWEYAKATRDPYAGDKLFRNDNGKFVDVSEAAGIKGSPMGYGLGVAISDINGDHLADIYVSNDFIEPDYLYVNNGDGTFSELMTEYFQHISHFSMGSDISDYNNDGWPDLITIDMLPADNKRQKLLYGPDNYEEYARRVLNGYYHQSMRNMLHLNNTNGTFSEIGQLSGISATDWSWSALLADFNNDGWKDFYVTNGYYRDVTDRDFLKFRGDYYFDQNLKQIKPDTAYIIENTKSTPVPNFIFENNGDLTFTDRSACWGMDELGFASGAAYADFDLDGDLDLVVNNINSKASFFKNNTQELLGQNYLALDLKGSDKNRNGYNAKLTLYTDGNMQFQEKMPTRGFQSSMTNLVHFGLGKSNKVDSLKIRWHSGTEQVIYNPKINTTLVVNQNDAREIRAIKQEPTTPLFTKKEDLLAEQHKEYPINDFKRQPLLMTMLTPCGPIVEAADVNADGLQDLFVGSSKYTESKILIQQSDGSFKNEPLIGDNTISTDGDALFADFNGDGHPDLYLVSGGYHDYDAEDENLKDRMFFNNGEGTYTHQPEALPELFTSGSSVAAHDVDADGDLDIFVGGRVIPGQYPVSPTSYLLLNDGTGRFATANIPESLAKAGMITDALWLDLDGDQNKELLIVGEFMPIQVFANNGGQLIPASERFLGDFAKSGLWSKILAEDFDGDGDTDFVIGNFGHNSQLQVKPDEPISLTFKDFDGNGSIEPILCSYIQGKSYPHPSRDDLTNQMFALRKKFTDFASYSEAQLDDVFTKKQLEDATTLYANQLSTIYLENQNGRLAIKALPIEAQFSPVFGMESGDFNEDGHLDFVLTGNQSLIRIRLGAIDANYGQVYLGDGKGNFSYLSQKRSGLNLKGDVKSAQAIQINGATHLVFGINNSPVEIYKLQK